MNNIFTGEWIAATSQGESLWIFEQLGTYIYLPGETAYGGILKQTREDGTEENRIYLYMPHDRLLLVEAPDGTERYEVILMEDGGYKLRQSPAGITVIDLTKTNAPSPDGSGANE